MPKTSKRTADAAAIRVLVRIARAAYFAADDLLLRSAEVELAEFGMTLADLGIEIDAPEQPSGASRG